MGRYLSTAFLIWQVRKTFLNKGSCAIRPECAEITITFT